MRDPGLHLNVSNEDYHRDHAAVSKSGLDRAAISGRHYQAYLAQAFNQTDAMVMGQMIHLACLEPELWQARHVVLPPDLNLRTKAGKAFMAKAYLDNPGKYIVKYKDCLVVDSCAAAVHTNKAAEKILSLGGPFEASAFAYNEQFGEGVKCRPDKLVPGACIDLKSCVDASPAAFSRSCAKYRYHVQAAYYLDVLKLAAKQSGGSFEPPTDFVFLAVEKSEPFGVALYTLESEDVDLGRALYERDLDRISKWRSRNEYPGYPEKIQSLSLPAWERQKGVEE